MAKKAPRYDPDPKTDQWFRWKGLEPPQRTPHLTREEVDEQLARNREEHKCEWKQQGNEIYCDASPAFRHGKRIRPDQRLIYENGKPRLVAMAPVPRDTEPAERLQK